MTDSIELEQYADIAPGCRNKVQRLSVVHKSVVQAKRELRVNLNRVTYITLGKLQAHRLTFPLSCPSLLEIILMFSC